MNSKLIKPMIENIRYKLKQIVFVAIVIYSTGASGSENVNVDLFHGQPNISIPIYNFKSKYLSVPIRLYYAPVDILAQGLNTSGDIPLDTRVYNPGWVGLGWNLQAGGVITRTVNVMPDERYSDPITNGPTGNFNNKTNGYDPLKDPDYLKKYETGEDEFTFNFCGYSGKFLYYCGEWKIYSEVDVVLKAEIQTEETKNGGEQYFSKFTIETPDGIIYTFGGTFYDESTSAIEFSNSYGDTYKPRVATSWYLTKIESPEGDQINFEYEHGDYIYYPTIVQSNKSSYKCYLDGISNSWVATSGFNIVSQTPSNDQIQNHKMGNTIQPVYLKSISSTTSPVSIQFNRLPYTMNYPVIQNREDKLDNILIGDCKFQLSFVDNASSINKTLKLKSIQESATENGASTTLPAYQFDYYDVTDILVPEVINSITFPTGGVSHFEYEKSYHTVIYTDWPKMDFNINNIDEVNNMTITKTKEESNGFRIKKQTTKSTESDKETLVTEYYYTIGNPVTDINNNQESGVKTLKIQTTRIEKTPQFYLDGKETIFILKNESGYDCSYPNELQWAFIKSPQTGYSSVWEVQSKIGNDNTSSLMGYTNYNYNNYMTIDYITNKVHINDASLAGKVVFMIKSNPKGGTISAYSLEYKERTETVLYRLYMKYLTFFDNKGQISCYGDPYGYSTKNPRYNIITKVEYENGSNLTTNYTYNDNATHLIQKEEVEYKPYNNSDGVFYSTTTTMYRYIDEFNPLTVAGNPNPNNTDLLHSIKNLPVETVVKKDGKVISAQFIKYKAIPTSLLNYPYFRPYQIYELELSAPIPIDEFKPTNVDWTINDSHYKLKKTFEWNDHSEYTFLQSQNSGSSPVSYIYDTNQLLKMELKNCSYSDWTNAGYSVDPTELRKSVSKAQITSYTYDEQFRMTSITGPNGVAVSKKYDGFGRLKYIKDNNGKIIQTKDYNFTIK